MTTPGNWDAAVAALRGAHRVVLTCHVPPDADALGGTLALGLALRAAGRDVVCSAGEPAELPEALGCLTGLDLLVSPDRVPDAPELLVTVDASHPDRLGDLTDRVTTAGTVLVIDHHATNPRFGTLNLVDPAAPASAVLVAALIDRLGVPLTADIATCLYAGLAADTGSFRFAGVTPETHALAGRLLATGIRHDRISRDLFDTHPFGWLALIGTALGRARLDRDAADGLGLAWTSVSEKDLVDLSLSPDQADSVVDLLRTAREAEVACVFKQRPDGTWAASVRSAGRIDVGAVCSALGGGGHRYAAGYTTSEPPERAVTDLVAALTGTPVPRC